MKKKTKTKLHKQGVHFGINIIIDFSAGFLYLVHLLGTQRGPASLKHLKFQQQQQGNAHITS